MTQYEPVPVAASVPKKPPADIFKQHRIDLHAVAQGVWIDVRGDRFLVSRLGTERSSKLRAQFLIDHDLAPEVDVPKDLQDEWGTFLFARGILLDAKWQAAPDLAYEPAQGERIYNDPELADLKNEISQRAIGDWTAATLAREAALGNLWLHSNGSTSAATSQTP